MGQQSNKYIGNIAADVEMDGDMDIALYINTNSHVYKINLEN